MMDERQSAPSVLLVDDAVEVRHILGIIFTHDGFEVVAEATNGLEAIAVAARTQPHFVILDYWMPEMDGQKTAEVLRTVCPETRIIAFSAVLERKPEWADAFISKDMIADLAPLLQEMARASGTHRA
jgi:CheY-like chemotaxis protein